MIGEASIATLKKKTAQHSNGLRILVMRHWPRGLSWQDIDFWLKSAGPSEELLAAWMAHLISWEDLLAQYRLEQQQQIAYIVQTNEDGVKKTLVAKGRSIDYLRQLEHQQGPITVYCWEQDEQCHRFLLVQLVEELGTILGEGTA